MIAGFWRWVTCTCLAGALAPACHCGSGGLQVRWDGSATEPGPADSDAWDTSAPEAGLTDGEAREVGPMGVEAQDGGALDAAPDEHTFEDAATADLFPADASHPVLDSASLDGVSVDAGCVPLTCALTSGYFYCGRIGDGCGAALSCECPAGPRPSLPMPCIEHICQPVGDCRPIEPAGCTLPTGQQYCGVIGNGCGTGNVDCGACRKPGWICTAGSCVGTPEVCVKASCAAENGDRYCGLIGDGCGASLDCGSTCPQAGWLCQNNRCVGTTAVCTKLSCRPARGGQYCGDISDGCGGTLACGACDDASPCGAVLPGICGENREGLPQPRSASASPSWPVSGAPAPLPPPPPSAPDAF